MEPCPIQVRPPDADIFIDGERWTGSEGNAPLQVAARAARIESKFDRRNAKYSFER